MPVSPLWKRKPTSKRAQAAMNSTVRRMPPSSFRFVTMASGTPSAIALPRSITCVEKDAPVCGAELRELLLRLDGILVVEDLERVEAPDRLARRRHRPAAVRVEASGAGRRSPRAPRAPSRPPRRARPCRPSPRRRRRRAARSSARSSARPRAGSPRPAWEGPGEAIGEVLRERDRRAHGAAQQRRERDAGGTAARIPERHLDAAEDAPGARARHPRECCASPGRSASPPRSGRGRRGRSADRADASTPAAWSPEAISPSPTTPSSVSISTTVLVSDAIEPYENR